jgi:ketosteroid isomerase-like protein
MNRPTNANDVHKSLAAAYNTGDINAVMKMYDAEGIIVAAPDSPVSGKEKFETAVKGILSIKGKMEIRTVYCLEAGDVAVGRSEWSIKDGNEIKVAAKGIELLKRQPDGTWKVLIDHAFGAEGNLVASE